MIWSVHERLELTTPLVATIISATASNYSIFWLHSIRISSICPSLESSESESGVVRNFVRMATESQEKSGDGKDSTAPAESLLDSIKSTIKSPRFRFCAAAWIFFLATVAASLYLLCIIRIKLIPDAAQFELSGLVYIPAILVPWLGFTAGAMATISTKLSMHTNPSPKLPIGLLLHLILGWGFCVAVGFAFVVLNPGVITTAVGGIAFAICSGVFFIGHSALVPLFDVLAPLGRSAEVEGCTAPAESLWDSIKSTIKRRDFLFSTAAWIFLIATVACSLCLLCVIRIKLIPDATQFELSGLVYIPAILVPWLGFTAGVMASISTKLSLDAILLGPGLLFILGWGFCGIAGLSFVIINSGVLATDRNSLIRVVLWGFPTHSLFFLDDI
jgi:hypothetical protein